MTVLKKYHPYVIFAVLAILAFAHNGSISLWDQDEAAYAGFAKNMLQSGNWIIPDFLWSDIHRKPPLHFWNIALSYQLFGVNEFSVRFSSAVFTLGTYLMVFLFGRKLFGHRVSIISTVVLSTTLLVPALAKVSVTDSTLLFFSTLCAFSVLRLIDTRSIQFAIIFWASFGCALLVKGPPIIIFSCVMVLMLFILHPKRKNLLRLHPWFFLPFAVAPFAVWCFMTVKEDNGVFLQWLFDWYVLKRINGSVLGQTGLPGTHILLIVAFFIPYLIFLPRAFRSAFHGLKRKNNQDLVLAVWFVSGWLIYEFSPSKLPAYCIVAHVPLAILVGKTIDQYLVSKTTPKNWSVVLQFILVLLLPIGLFTASILMELSDELKVGAALILILMISGQAVSYRLRNRANILYSILGVNLLFQSLIMVYFLPKVDGLKNSSKRVAAYLIENASAQSTVVLANKKGHPPSLVFYNDLYFNQVVEDDKLGSLLSLYASDEPCALVLNEKQKRKFLEKHPHLVFHRVTSHLVDRKGMSDYYIVINDAGKLVNRLGQDGRDR